MMRRTLSVFMIVVFVGVVAFVAGCESVFQNTTKENREPEVWLSSGPVEGDTTGYRVHFYWGGWDPDGEVKAYEFVVVRGSVNGIGFNPADTTGLDKWTQTAVHDSVFSVEAGERSRKVTINNISYTRYDMTHTFFVRAVDLQGKRSVPAYRSFTAWTLAPSVTIDQPRLPGSGTVSVLGRVIRFKWTGRDPIDDPNNVQDPDSVRYFYTLVVDTTGKYDESFSIVDDLNKNPWRYDHMWGPWIWYRAPLDSGRSTLLGDDEVLVVNKSHVFAVQAKDEAGAVTAIFDKTKNLRRFVVSNDAVPLLKITEPFLGGFVFRGTNLRVETRDLPPGVTLNFRWRADASDYGGEIQCYRYGWDVLDLNDPNQWAGACSPFTLGCKKTLYSGVHILYIEAYDNSGGVTLGRIEIDVVPFTMERNLLWVDDFFSSDFIQVDWATPTEKQHDDFWLGLCGKAAGFDRERDVYDVYYGYNKKPPPISLIGLYRNIIWSYSSAPDVGAWDDVVYFTPETSLLTGSRLTLNYLSIFLARGGHLLTEGRSERGGGLAAVLGAQAQVFPLSLKCEITGPKDGCEGDTSGVSCMAYKDYCISILDKIRGTFRTGNDMPVRRESWDGLTFGRRDATDSVTASLSGLPDSLGLWEEIVKPGRFFDPKQRGFAYVEVYDPAYWMVRNGLTSQACFHPMYRMYARSTVSPVHRAPMALVITKYKDIDADNMPGGTIAAPSFHFGTELWFFNRSAVNAIMNVILDRWGILASP
jgi:hypothetical protein